MDGPYSCPECAAALVYQAGESSQLGAWLCPTCGINFGDEDALKKAIMEKVKKQ